MQIIPSGAFAGLSGLQRLQILGDGDSNSEEPTSSSSPPPSLQPDTFRQLSGLASLDLTGNGLASLPRGTFCHVANLRSLNLSSNSVRQLTDIGELIIIIIIITQPRRIGLLKLPHLFVGVIFVPPGSKLETGYLWGAGWMWGEAIWQLGNGGLVFFSLL